MSDTDTSRYRTYPGEGEVSQPAFFNPPHWNISPYTFLWSPLVTLDERKSGDVPGNRKTWKPFEHYKLATATPSSVQKVRYVSSEYSGDLINHMVYGDCSYPTAFYNYEYGAPGKPIAGLPELYTPTMDGHFIAPPAGLGSLLDDAMRSIVPKVKADLSLVNSVIELKDFKSWGTAIRKGLLLKSKWGAVIAALNKLKGSTLRDKARLAADAYLQYKFNISPLISDIQGVYHSLYDQYRRINKAIAEQGRPRVGHFTVSLNEGLVDRYDVSSERSLYDSSTRTGWASSCQQITGTSSSERFVSQGSSVFHVEILYSVRYADYQVEHARLLSILDGLGVNVNPAIIWNAIPWSFVVDWVAGVSRYLDRQKLGFMDPALCIHKALWSIRRTRQILVQTKVRMMGEGHSPLWPQMLTHPLTVETAYRRQTFGLGDVVTRFKTSGLNATELSLAGALAISRRPRKRNWRISR